MDTVTAFAALGARARVSVLPPGAVTLSRGRPVAPALDVRRDRRGEFYAIAVPSGVAVTTLDVRPRDRHLVLALRDGAEISRFLCGHDERHWFVAAIPESRPVTTVPQAMEALKPTEVLRAQRAVGAGLKKGTRNRRRNAAFVRQGEWFFVPQPAMVVEIRFVLRREPLSRGGGAKSHLLEEAYREGGTTVYIPSVPWGGRELAAATPALGGGLTGEEQVDFLQTNPAARSWGWSTRVRDPLLFARGRVWHPDHATITLPGWSRVLMNAESQARARASVVFLD
jgi:hypothetical protein